MLQVVGSVSAPLSKEVSVGLQSLYCSPGNNVLSSVITQPFGFLFLHHVVTQEKELSEAEWTRPLDLGLSFIF